VANKLNLRLFFTPPISLPKLNVLQPQTSHIPQPYPSNPPISNPIGCLHPPRWATINQVHRLSWYNTVDSLKPLHQITQNLGRVWIRDGIHVGVLLEMLEDGEVGYDVANVLNRLTLACSG
jgi:hypothetical protein